MPRQKLKQRKDGRFICIYKGIKFYGNTSDEALAKRDAFKQQLKLGLREKALGITVMQYATSWIVAYKNNVSRNTYNSYARYLNYACDQLGSFRMRDVTATDIQRLYNTLDGKSKSYIKKFMMLVKHLFASAVDDGLIIRSPVGKAKPPQAEEHSHRAIEQWERDLIAAQVGKHDMAPAAMAMLYAGLRRGEALALDIDRDVDFDNDKLYVREAVVFEGNTTIISNTKTEAGNREIFLFEPLKNALQGMHGLLLKKADGEIMTQAAWKRKWQSFIVALETDLNGCHKRWYGKTKDQKDNELPPWKSINIRSHDLRHSFCTMLYDADVDIKTAMKWMGHADEKMILKVYAHLTEQKEKEAAQAVGKHINSMLNVQNNVQK